MDNEYSGSILVFDVIEKHYLQQGCRDDQSSYSFDELIKELNEWKASAKNLTELSNVNA